MVNFTWNYIDIFYTTWMFVSVCAFTSDSTFRKSRMSTLHRHTYTRTHTHTPSSINNLIYNISVPVCFILQHANAATSSTTSVGGGSGAGTGPSGSLGGSTAPRPAPGSSGHSGTKFRHGLLQLMIHTIDPLHDGKL